MYMYMYMYLCNVDTVTSRMKECAYMYMHAICRTLHVFVCQRLMGIKLHVHANEIFVQIHVHVCSGCSL